MFENNLLTRFVSCSVRYRQYDLFSNHYGCIFHSPFNCNYCHLHMHMSKQYSYHQGAAGTPPLYIRVISHFLLF